VVIGSEQMVSKDISTASQNRIEPKSMGDRATVIHTYSIERRGHVELSGRA